jgi:adenylate cyclase
MAIEIERKFLVRDSGWRLTPGLVGTPYAQGYLTAVPERTVRVRIASEQAYLTIKGPSSGASRLEFEYAIPLADAETLLSLCELPAVTKYRYNIDHAGLVWEVDEFLGANQGLIMAEVELSRPDQAVELPTWVGKEVTGDPRYYNTYLARQPYSTWTETGSS